MRQDARLGGGGGVRRGAGGRRRRTERLPAASRPRLSTPIPPCLSPGPDDVLVGHRQEVALFHRQLGVGRGQFGDLGHLNEAERGRVGGWRKKTGPREASAAARGAAGRGMAVAGRCAPRAARALSLPPARAARIDARERGGAGARRPPPRHAARATTRALTCAPSPAAPLPPLPAPGRSSHRSARPAGRERRARLVGAPRRASRSGSRGRAAARRPYPPHSPYLLGELGQVHGFLAVGGHGGGGAGAGVVVRRRANGRTRGSRPRPPRRAERARPRASCARHSSPPPSVRRPIGRARAAAASPPPRAALAPPWRPSANPASSCCLSITVSVGREGERRWRPPAGGGGAARAPDRGPDAAPPLLLRPGVRVTILDGRQMVGR